MDIGKIGKSLKLAFLDPILREKLLESYYIKFNEPKIDICKIGKALKLAFWKA